MNRQERGALSVEAVIILPALIAMIYLFIGFARVAEAKQDVAGAAASAARAASLVRDGSSAAAAQSTAQAQVTSSGLSCTALDVTTNLSNYKPGGSVTVTVSCSASMSGLGGGLVSSRTYSSSAVVPIEITRAS